MALASCKNEKNKVLPKAGQTIIIGVANVDGKKNIRELLRVIYEGIETDSATGVKTIVTDTAYGYLDVITILDSTGKALKKVNGYDSTMSTWLKLSKDSVNTHIENVPLQELLKN